MIFWRKNFFYLFLGVYLIVTPWVTLRMLGYVWYPTSFRIVKMGLAVVNSSPLQANVYVDGKRAPKSTPVIIHELVPGDHFIRLEKEGYQDWVSHFDITSNKVTLLENIHLVPASP